MSWWAQEAAETGGSEHAAVVQDEHHGEVILFI